MLKANTYSLKKPQNTRKQINTQISTKKKSIFGVSLSFEDGVLKEKEVQL